MDQGRKSLIYIPQTGVDWDTGEWGQKTVSFLFLQYFLKQNYFLGGNGMDCLIGVRCLGLAKERFFLTQFSAFFFLL